MKQESSSFTIQIHQDLAISPSMGIKLLGVKLFPGFNELREVKPCFRFA